VGLSVLVDIFARDADGSIKITKSGLIETHTIVLYKNGAKKFAVIDPSNSDFSKHILWNSEILLGVKDIEICVPNSLIKIYIPGSQDNVGPGQDQYRDCIDIAYKIAANLKRVNPDSFDLKQLKDHDVIKMISNSLEIDDSIVAAVSRQDPVRIKQASEAKVVELYYEIEKFFKKGHEAALQIGRLEVKVTDVEKAYADVLKYECDAELTPKYSLVLDALLECSQSMYTFFETEVRKELGVLGGQVGGDDE
jgi:hypothetical protein